jgi:hypothetical protein
MEVLSIIWMAPADSVHQPVPDACLAPSIEAVVAGGAWTVALGQVAPRRTGPQHPENAIQYAPVIDARHASGLIGLQRLDHAPLEVGQIISAHANAESGRTAGIKPRSVLSRVQLAHVEADHESDHRHQHACDGEDGLLRICQGKRPGDDVDAAQRCDKERSLPGLDAKPTDRGATKV